jgi:hypothetical protein
MIGVIIIIIIIIIGGPRATGRPNSDDGCEFYEVINILLLQ